MTYIKNDQRERKAWLSLAGEIAWQVRGLVGRSVMTHIDAFIHYIRNYALADHASMGICHYAIEISN
jgi:hypothetical protein